MGKNNEKSDKKAKDAYVEVLKQRGYKKILIANKPSDIKAEKEGNTYYFEIKMTKQKDIYFGAATLTEWAQALETPNFFTFVIAKTNEAEDKFEFIEFTPSEFMKHSTIPPFKIFFNIDLNKETLIKKRRTAVSLTDEIMKLLSALYTKIKTEVNNSSPR